MLIECLLHWVGAGQGFSWGKNVPQTGEVQTADLEVANQCVSLSLLVNICGVEGEREDGCC